MKQPKNSIRNVFAAELKELPDELKAQLRQKPKMALRSGSHANALLTALEQSGKPMSINDLLIAVYRTKAVVLKRQAVMHLLHTLTKNALCVRVSLGVYAPLPKRSRPQQVKEAA